MRQLDFVSPHLHARHWNRIEKGAWCLMGRFCSRKYQHFAFLYLFFFAHGLLHVYSALALAQMSFLNLERVHYWRRVIKEFFASQGVVFALLIRGRRGRFFLNSDMVVKKWQSRFIASDGGRR